MDDYERLAMSGTVAVSEPAFWAAIGQPPVEITVAGFLRVLIPVTIGNILGGGVLVALVYWFVYLRPLRL